MEKRGLFCLTILAGLLGGRLAGWTAAGASALPQTKPEATAYRETSTFADVVDFVRSLQALSPNLRVETLLTTPEGKAVPLVVVGDPLPASPAAARLAGRPVICIQGNIHAGEVEGKEAALSLLRDLTVGSRRDWARQAVFLLIPIFNADGNDQMSPKNRSYMPNPEKGVGVRSNSQNLDLNRDYVKTESREVRAFLEKVLLPWDPLVFMDLHTTDGSFHRETVTWTSPEGPNWDPSVSGFLWRQLYPAVDKAMRAKGIPTLPYGDFKDDFKPELGWGSFPGSPRVGVDYVGLRNRFSILVEMYAYVGFDVRVAHCREFLDAVLAYVLGHAEEMAQIARDADRRAAATALAPSAERARLALSVDTLPLDEPLTVETFEVVKPAEPQGYPRVKPLLDKPKTVTVPHYRRIVATAARILPFAYALRPGCEKAVRQLLRHGIAVERLLRPVAAKAETFLPTALKLEEALSEGHARVRLSGTWESSPTELTPGWYVVRLNQPLAMLASLLLEPDHPDSLVSWNFFDAFLTQQWTRNLLPLPYVRIPEPLLLVTRGVEPGEAD